SWRICCPSAVSAWAATPHSRMASRVGRNALAREVMGVPVQEGESALGIRRAGGGCALFPRLAGAVKVAARASTGCAANAWPGSQNRPSRYALITNGQQDR